MPKEIIHIIYSCSQCPYLLSNLEEFESQAHIKVNFSCKLTSKYLASQLVLVKQKEGVPSIEPAGDLTNGTHPSCPLPDHTPERTTEKIRLSAAPTEAALDIPKRKNENS